MAIPAVLLSPPVLLGGASALLLIGYLIWQSQGSAGLAAPAGTPNRLPIPVGPRIPIHIVNVGALARAAALQAAGVVR
jgi:hypothetical protein